MTRLGLVVSILLFGAVPALGGQRPQSACGAPKYRVAYRYSDGSKDAAVAVSIDPQYVNLRNLLALTCEFRGDFPDAETVGVNIFNNYEAAKKADVHGVEERAGERRYLDAFIASYHLERSMGKEILTLVGDPRHPCGNDIDIDLRNRSVAFVHCK